MQMMKPMKYESLGLPDFSFLLPESEREAYHAKMREADEAMCRRMDEIIAESKRRQGIWPIRFVKRIWWWLRSI